MQIKITPLLIIYKQQLNNTICDDDYGYEYNKDETQHDGDNETENNDIYILTDDTEELKLVKMSSQSEIEDIYKIYIYIMKDIV